jgi:hypothetical protein
LILYSHLVDQRESLLGDNRWVNEHQGLFLPLLGVESAEEDDILEVQERLKLWGSPEEKGSLLGRTRRLHESHRLLTALLPRISPRQLETLLPSVT